MGRIGRLLFILTLALFSTIRALDFKMGPDFHWYLEDGKYFITYGKAPSENIYSCLKNTHWISNSIGFSALLYLVYKKFGKEHTWTLFFPLFFIFYFLLGFLLYREGMKLGEFLLLYVLVYFITYGSMMLRPQVFSFIFVILLLLIEKYRKNWAWLILILPLWSVLHGGVIIGIALIGLFSIEKFISGERREGLKILFYEIVGISLIVLFNPYHFDYLREIFKSIFSDRSVMALYIVEWSPLWKLLPAYTIPALSMLVILILFLIHFKKFTLFEKGLFLLFFIAGIKVAKVLPVSGIINGYIISKHIALKDLTLGFEIFEKTSGILLLLVIDTVLLGYFLLLKDKSLKLKPRFFPVEAVKYLKSHRQGGKLLAPSDRGGYIEYHLYPEYRIYLDGRLAAPVKILEDFGKFWLAQFPVDSFLKIYKPDYVLVPSDIPVMLELMKRQKDFKLVFKGKNFWVFEKIDKR